MQVGQLGGLGMPGAVHRAGLADAVLPLDRIAGEIVRRTSEGRCACFCQNPKTPAELIIK